MRHNSLSAFIIHAINPHQQYGADTHVRRKKPLDWNIEIYEFRISQYSGIRLTYTLDAKK